MVNTSNQVVAVAIVPAAVVLAVFASDVLRLWTGSDDIAVLVQRQAELARRLAEAEAHWLAAEEALERADAIS